MSETYGKHYSKMRLRLNLSKGREVDQAGHCRKTSEQIEAETKGVEVKVYSPTGELIEVKKS